MFSAKGLHRFNHGRADNDVAPLGPDCRPEDADQSRRTDRPQGCAINVDRIFHDEPSVRRLVARFPDPAQLRVCYDRL